MKYGRVLFIGVWRILEQAVFKIKLKKIQWVLICCFKKKKKNNVL